ncbi:type II toxin-antitoxin system VapC family toxin [Paracoccaceae bacterium Fryx2]|nr:type II toxin-antitoxin system VapC family toxin [Paracoccaceae bacterium Fryx2]
MRLLVDTHVLIWAVLEDAALPPRFRDALSDPAAEVHISAVSVWEVAIKRALGKLSVPHDLFDQAALAGCLPLPVTWGHAAAVEALPPHHADPFDRMLIAQARVEGLTLLSADRHFAAYDVTLL